MGHHSVLMGCRSAEEAIAQAKAMFGDGDYLPAETGPHLVARYAIPLFWIAAFAASDRIWFERRYEEDEETAEIPVYWSPTPAAVARLRARKPVMLAIAGETFAGFYDEWIAFLESNYPSALLLQAEDILGIDGVATSAPKLHAAIEALDADTPVKTLRDMLHRVGASVPRARDARPSQQPADHCRGVLAGSSDGVEDIWPTPGTAAEAAALAAPGKPWWKFWG